MHQSMNKKRQSRNPQHYVAGCGFIGNYGYGTVYPVFQLYFSKILYYDRDDRKVW